jgi:hypothetical protein
VLELEVDLDSGHLIPGYLFCDVAHARGVPSRHSCRPP